MANDQSTREQGQGFAAMTKEERTRIAREGGKARQEQMTDQERIELARKGGVASRGSGRSENE